MNNTTLVVIAKAAAAAALFGMAAITIVTIPTLQEAEARGCKSSLAVNASKGRCFHP
jgi:hypothetical protein